jgi:hypothetical protein
VSVRLEGIAGELRRDALDAGKGRRSQDGVAGWSRAQTFKTFEDLRM